LYKRTNARARRQDVVGAAVFADFEYNPRIRKRCNFAPTIACGRSVKGPIAPFQQSGGWKLAVASASPGEAVQNRESCTIQFELENRPVAKPVRISAPTNGRAVKRTITTWHQPFTRRPTVAVAVAKLMQDRVPAPVEVDLEHGSEVAGP